MGGGKAGEVASAMLVNETEKAFAAIKGKSTPGEREGAFIRTAYRVNFMIKSYAEERAYPSMGATVIGLVLDPWMPNNASVFHAGDSRAYRIRNNEIEQLMEDHSLEADQKPGQSKLPMQLRGVLTNALGMGDDFFLERTSIDVQEDDVFLLCSDGLTRMVKDAEILRIFMSLQNEEMNVIGSSLLEAALERGGRDNVSLILLRIKKTAEEYDPTPEEAKREADAQMRNLMDLTDTPATEMAYTPNGTPTSEK